LPVPQRSDRPYPRRERRGAWCTGKEPEGICRPIGPPLLRGAQRQARMPVPSRVLRALGPSLPDSVSAGIPPRCRAHACRSERVRSCRLPRWMRRPQEILNTSPAGIGRPKPKEACHAQHQHQCQWGNPDQAPHP